MKIDTGAKSTNPPFQFLFSRVFFSPPEALIDIFCQNRLPFLEIDLEQVEGGPWVKNFTFLLFLGITKFHDYFYLYYFVF